MSEVKVNKLTPRTNCGTVTLGDSGDTFTIPAGVTITNNGTQTGFGRTGTVDWQTTKKTAAFDAVSGEGYFVDTSSATITVTLPASPSANAIVAVSDYNGSAGTNSITVARNSSKINGETNDYTISKSKSAVTFVYVDATAGWTSVQTSNVTDNTNPFITATGGTETECGNFKIHTFTGPGTFTVSNAATCAGNNIVSYMVVAGGGGGGGDWPACTGGGGAGAGGFREFKNSSDSYTASPLNGNPGGTSVTVSATAYPITVGAGGAGRLGAPGTPTTPSDGSPSVFSTVTSTGGGGGSTNIGPAPNPGRVGGPGGSGGGSTYYNTPGYGTGNTPPVSPGQGTNGGAGSPNSGNSYMSGGGGGAIDPGSGGNPGGGDGGDGATTGISGSNTTYAGGGGGGYYGPVGPRAAGQGGPGGGGNGGQPPCGPAGTPATGRSDGSNGTANTGGGGGGGTGANPSNGGGGADGGSGGSGIVIIRYKFQ